MSVKILNHTIGDHELPVMLINLKHRSIISLPTQIGCAIGCTFCISGDNEFQRSLTADELVELVEFGLEHIKHEQALVSFTGEGEPFLNLKNINQAMSLLHENDAISHFRLCTSGIRPNLFCQVAQYSKPVNLQLSLHSLNDEVRFRLIPKTKPVENILDALRAVTGSFNEIAINYVLMSQVNDSDDDIEALTQAIDPRWVVKFNPLLDDGPYTPSDRAEEFVNSLAEAGQNAIAYNAVGSKISNGLYGHLTHAQNNRIA